MRIADCGRDLGTGQPQAVRLSRTFGFADPEGELRKPLFVSLNRVPAKSRYSMPADSVTNCFVIIGCPRATAFQSM
jgi:hypothetical protein